MQLVMVTAGILLLAHISSAAVAQTVTPRQIANVRKAAVDFAELLSTNGADAAEASVLSCYREGLASAKTSRPQLEYCITQDVLLSQTQAEIYAHLASRGRRPSGLPDPDEVIARLTKRVTAAFSRLKVPPDEVSAFLRW